jgi:hypothetical protein
MVKIEPNKTKPIAFQIRDRLLKKNQEEKRKKIQITADQKAHDETVKKIMDLWDMQQHPLITSEHQIILEKARQIAIVKKQKLTKELIKSVNEIYNRIHPK